MRTTGILLLSSVLAFSLPAAADDYVSDRAKPYGAERSDSRSDYHGARRQAHPVTLRVRVKGDGDGTIRLKRLLRHQHDIDTDDWRIRQVNVYSKGRRDACADLRVGNFSTGPVLLRRGVTRIQAPHSVRDGHWKLEVENARIREIAIVLEPKRGDYRNARYDRDYRYDRGYRDRGRRSDRDRFERVALNWGIRF